MPTNGELNDILNDLDSNMLKKYLQYNKVTHKDIKYGFKKLCICTDTETDNDEKRREECMNELYKHMKTVTPLYNKLSTMSLIGIQFAFRNHLISPSSFFWKQKEFDYKIVIILENEQWRNAIVKANQSKTKNMCIKLFANAIEQISFIGIEDYNDKDYVKRYAKILSMLKIKIKAEVVSKLIFTDIEEVYNILNTLKIL